VLIDMRDGLWAVVTDEWAAGFVIEHGRVTMCAPILRRKLDLWMRRARWVCP
jgi:hypothetical protein